MPLRLLWRNLLAHPIRALLTTGSVGLAVFLICLLDATARGLTAAVDLAAQNRLVVGSAVSLFVNLPIAYEPKIAAVPGVAEACKLQWFGGRYRERGGFFAQFGVEADKFQSTYPELEVVGGSYDAFAKLRTGCIIGQDLANTYGWKVGDRVPLVSSLFPRGRSGEEAFEFTVSAIYVTKVRSIDQMTLYFHFDYLGDAIEQGDCGGQEGVGVYAVRLAEGAEAEQVMAGIDGLFANGPQRTETTTEAEFNRQFVTMLGNVPLLLRSIGGAVLFAIFFAVLNTMLMAGRERTRDLGIMKALGFGDGTLGALLVSEAVLLSLGGALLGAVAVKLAEGPVTAVIAPMAPGFAIDLRALGEGFLIAAVLGVVSGAMPGLRAMRLLPVKALRQED